MRMWLTRAVRSLIFAALIALGCAWLALVAPSDAQAAAGGVATVTGSVTNGTTSGTPIADQQVTLQLSVGGKTTDLASVKADAQGRFTFSNVDVTPATLGGDWATYTRFQGGLYSSAPMRLTGGQTADGSIKVYNATQSAANLSVSIATILVRPPDAKHGLLGVGEFFTIRNSGTTAFVGQAPTGPSTSMPSLLRFALPPNAKNLNTGVGFFNTETIQIATGFAATATVPPGATEFAFAFDVPYTGTTLDIPFKAEYPTQQVVALVPPNILVRDATGLTAQGIVTSFGARYQVFTATNAQPNDQVTVHLYDLPQAGERQDLNRTGLFVLAGVLAIMLALLAGAYVWRGAILAAFGIVPAGTLARTSGAGAEAASETPAERDARRKRLLEDLLELERRHARGEIGEQSFKRQESEIRQRLRDLLAMEDIPTAEGATGATPGVETRADASMVERASNTTGGGAR